MYIVIDIAQYYSNYCPCLHLNESLFISCIQLLCLTFLPVDQEMNMLGHPETGLCDVTLFEQVWITVKC